MVMRFDRHERQWRDVQLATRDSNPTQQPPIDPAFTYHLNRLAIRLGRMFRLVWSVSIAGVRHNIWGIQERQPNGDWHLVFAAYDETRSSDECEYPYMPLDMRVIDEFANSCLELRYDTDDAEKARLMFEAEQAARVALEEEAEHQAGIERIAGMFTKSISGTDEGDNKRAAKRLRYEAHGPVDGTGFKEIWAVPTPKVTPEAK
jgi:hypothetical protein